MAKLFEHEDEYNQQILKVSQEEGVPYSVIKGFMALESAFDPRSYRAEPAIADASYGLMQTLYGTAKKVGYTGTTEGLFDPYTSIKYGARFIGGLHKQYGNVLDLISAYNAGYPRPITKTTQYIADLYKYPIGYKDQPPEGWVYANQPYVDRVAAYIAYYQAKELNDPATAQIVLNLIKKKTLHRALPTCASLIGVLLWGRPTMPPISLPPESRPSPSGGFSRVIEPAPERPGVLERITDLIQWLLAKI